MAAFGVVLLLVIGLADYHGLISNIVALIGLLVVLGIAVIGLVD